MANYAGRYDELLLRNVRGRLTTAHDSTVMVYESNGTTVATLYTDRTKATTAANPVEVDANGNLEFFADPGIYVLSIREDGTEVARNTASVGPDAEDIASRLDSRRLADTLTEGENLTGVIDITSSEGRRFVFNVEETTVSEGVRNPVMAFGWNVSGSGSRLDNTDAAAMFNIESRYRTGGVDYVEFHWQMVTEAGATYRPVSAKVARNGSAATVSVRAGEFYVYDQATGNPALNFSPAQRRADWAAYSADGFVMTVSPASGASSFELVSADAAVGLNLKHAAASAGGLNWIRADVLKWQLQNQATDLLRLLDAANSRDHLTFTAGASADAALAAVNSRLTVGASSAPGAALHVIAPTTSTIVQMAQGLAGQSADLFQWKVDASVAMSVDQVGRLWVQPSGDTRIGATVDAALGVSPRTTGGVGAVIRGIGGQTGDLMQLRSSADAVLTSFTSSGLLRWVATGNEQTTVGAAGAASALPANPTKYLKVVDSAGTTLVIPAYAA